MSKITVITQSGMPS